MRGANGAAAAATATAAPEVISLFEGVRVAAFVVHGNADVSSLHDDEYAFVATASDVRKREFAAGRACARAALASFGQGQEPLSVGINGQPLWPAGFMGSISHTSGFAVAVATPESEVSIGIDCEAIGSVSADLYDIVLTTDEQLWIHQLSDDEQSEAATEIFSAKEAWYKAQHALTHRWEDFDAISFSPSASGLVGKPTTKSSDIRWPPQIRSTVIDSILVTGAVVSTAPKQPHHQ